MKDLDEVISENSDQKIIDLETGEAIDWGENSESFTYETPKIISGGNIVSEKRDKIYITGVSVSILNERVQYLDENGKLQTMTLKDYTRKELLQQFSSLDDFLTTWSKADQKTVLIKELEEQGLILEELQELVKQDYDLLI